MSRPLTSIDIIALPRMDASTVIALASALEATAAEAVNQGAVLSDSIADARAEVVQDCAALQTALGSASEPEPVIRAVDLREDAAAGAMYHLCQAWARLAGEIPEGDTGKALSHRVFADGLEFINYKARKEWSVIDTKLKVIDEENLEAEFAKLGALPMLAHLRKVHAHYGEVTGMTKPTAIVESPLVGEKRIALLDSIRHYVVAVNGSVRRKLPATQELANKLLHPLTEWQSATPKPSPKKE